MSNRLAVLTVTMFLAISGSVLPDDLMPVPGITYQPRQYVCYRTPNAIVVDGDLSDSGWRTAPWTELFSDIEGALKPAPRFETRAKMLWDTNYFYVCAELKEPDVWGTLTERDAVIYHDNDFEVFIDPDMDTHEYYELEINALNTVWDLLLLKPYRDGGPAVNAWDIQGLKTAVAMQGTLNQPGDTDSGWTVEIAIPWKVLAECAHRPSPPKDGDQWKVNFSRVEWKTVVRDGAYVKETDPSTGKSLPEDNWVWSPQGLIAMHYPEMWGIVQFSDAKVGEVQVPFNADPLDSARWILRQIYYAQRNHFSQHHRYSTDLDELDLRIGSVNGFVWPPTVEITSDSFDAAIRSSEGRLRLRISEDGRIVTEQ